MQFESAIAHEASVKNGAFFALLPVLQYILILFKNITLHQKLIPAI